MTPPEPSLRKPLGVLAILAWIGFWSVAATSLRWPESWGLQALWFAVLGLVWVAPLKPVLRWMERSAVRAPRAGGD